MTLAHDASASGGLRVSHGQSEVQATCHQPHHATSTQLGSQGTLLAIARASVISPYTTRQVRLLIDPGSEISLITEQIVNQLRLKRQYSPLAIVGVGGKGSSKSKGIVTCIIQSLTSSAVITISAHVLPKLTILPTFHSARQEWQHISNLKLADPHFLTPQSIDIIIGADYYGQIIKPNIIKASPSMPIAQLSIFGWVIIGPMTTSPALYRVVHHSTAERHSYEEQLDNLLTKFWVQEEVPSHSIQQLSPEEQECEEHFMRTHQRHSSGKYIVRLPLKSTPSLLGDSHQTAYRCIQRTLRKLKTNTEYNQLYTDFMKEYEELHHMRRAPGNFTKHIQNHHPYYLPHHGVLKPDSVTTKLRVVFNGSSPTSTGHSLNDLMHTGAKLQRDITDVLLWVRQHQYIFTTDITKMYRQIMVHEDDWDLQRILWVDEDSNIVPFQLTTVTYGTRSAPFLAVRVLLQLINDEGHRFPLAVPPLKYGRYVDDIFGGADSTEELIKVANQLTDLCMAGGFPLAKWHSNDVATLEAISSSPIIDHPITIGDCTTKLLGLLWHPSSDNFTFTSRLSPSISNITKRSILSEVAQIFDPLGLLAPLTIRAKVLLQGLWLHKLTWDQPVPSNLRTSWVNLKEELTQLETLSIPRWIHTTTSSSCELHGFSDASQLAIAAAVYVKVTSLSSEPCVTLLCAKTKVAPLKRLTIPRLELAAALLLSKLMTYVQATLNVNITSTTLWTDSLVTLTWIKTHPSRWKDFVRNRVASIQELTQNSTWKYVPGKQNPADCASRSTSIAQLTDHSLWWTGPPWLSKSESHWPTQPDPSDEAPSQEARPGTALVMTVLQHGTQWDLIHRYSSLKKLMHITAIIFRAISAFKGIPGSSLATPINPTDLEKASSYWAKSTQAAYFKEELKLLANNQKLPHSHAFNRLTAFIDAQGIIRVGGRLQHSTLDPASKHPIILPRHSPLSKLIISEAHSRTMHGGTQLTLAEIRRTHWIIGGRAPVKSHILRCLKCARQRGIRAQQLMGQLPLSRLQPSRPFDVTGIDYAGPLTIKTWKGRGAKLQKAWICVFVCMTTSAIHIEVVGDYSTDGFIAAYRRFTARRGICHSIYSDCGTNFMGANAELKALFTQGTREHQVIAKLFVNDHTKWHFNPPAAPHMGGKWEAAVKSIKHHLCRTIGDSSLTIEELTTLLTQIEAILNSRPLEPLSDDPEDISALTPGHFLIGRAITTLPEPSLIDIKPARLSRWQLIQQQTQIFWNHWSTSYMQRQLAISKWYHKNNELKVGSLVLLTDERFPPSKWPLSRIVELHPGADGLARVATIKTATSTLTRPINKLAILPSDEHSKEESSIHC